MEAEKLATEVAIGSLDAAYKNRNQILSALQSGLSRLKDGKVTVAIFGPGGVGKSTTQTLLCDGLAKAEKNLAYFPTVDAKKKRAKDNWTISVWDTPGQEDFRNVAWVDAFKGVEGSRRCLLINIVSYGYNSTGSVPYAELRKISPKKTKPEVIRTYLRVERKKEAQLIAQLEEQIKPIKCKVHLLTIINKQDLWWAHRDQVLSHYRTGPYAKAVAKIASSRPKILFAQSLKEVSLCPVNLKTSDNEILAETCRGYDAAVREYYLTHLLSELNQIVK
jgi:GTPase SAR1 family protein